jgi:hypothetical protein
MSPDRRNGDYDCDAPKDTDKNNHRDVSCIVKHNN